MGSSPSQPKRPHGLGDRSASVNDLSEYERNYNSPRDPKEWAVRSRRDQPNRHSNRHHRHPQRKRNQMRNWNSDLDVSRQEQLEDMEYQDFDARSFESDDSGFSSSDSGGLNSKPRFVNHGRLGAPPKNRQRAVNQDHFRESPQNMKMYGSMKRRNQKRVSPAPTANLKTIIQSPKSSRTWSEKLPVFGQGTVFFNLVRNTPFSIVVRKPGADNYIALDVTKKGAFFTKKLGNKTEVIAATDDDEHAGYQPNINVTYWLSYDRDNLVLRYGTGYMMVEAILLEHDFLEYRTKDEAKEIRKELYELFNPKEKRFIELYEVDKPENLRSAYNKYIQRLQETQKKNGRNITMESVLSVDGKTCMNKFPLKFNRPGLVLESDKVNLFFLDRGDFTFSANLPPSALELFENVKKCDLNWPNEVDGVLLSDAIRYSIETKGCLLNKKLKEKGQAGFDGKPNLNQTYLRITLGNSLGTSPGIPYVLEIWPSKHFSPIHNHGNSSAVIKVLHGTIHARIFNKIATDIYGKEEAPQLLIEFDAKYPDCTWMDRNWYQTHQLENISDDFCATIQCYNYDDADDKHWPYFDFIDSNDNISEFLPNTDFTFIQMRDQVLSEYRSSLR